MLSDVLKPGQIAGFFSRSTFGRGHDYQARGHVTLTDVDEEACLVSASVEGSDDEPYEVDVSLTFTGDRLVEVSGDCSCPVGFNCKHVAATLLEVAAEGAPASAANTSKRPGTTGQFASPAPEILPPDISLWLEKIGGAVRGDDYPQDITQRVIYCVEPYIQEGRTPHLAVSVLSVKYLKEGRLADRASRVNLASFNLNTAPRFFRDVDVEIAAAMAREVRTYGQHDVYLLSRAELVKQMADTGRAYWRDHRRNPLQWGATRQGRIEWRQASQKGIASHLVVEGAAALCAEPPVYVDEAAGIIGPVECSLPARLVRQLLSAPVIARAHVEQVARLLAAKLPSLDQQLLPPPPSPAIDIDVAPVPVLRLIRLRDHYGGGSTVIRPSFRYGAIEIEPSEKADRVETFSEGQVYAVVRRTAAERKALKRLADFGPRKARSIFRYSSSVRSHDLAFAQPRDWLDFLNTGAPRLRADGFEIHVDDDFPYRLAETSGDFDADFESSGIDWFELSIGVEIDGRKRDLAPLLAALISDQDFAPDRIRQLAEAGDHFYLPLGDGRHLSLVAKRLLPLVLALHGLKLAGWFGGTSAKIRLSRADVAPLLAFESQDFAFGGADNLRRLAGLLQTRGLTPPQLPPRFNAQLRPYQAQGVAWLDLLRESGLGGVLADDMGLGKTVQILALLALEKARGHFVSPALVVAPTSLMTNWFNEAQKFAPELRVLVLHGPDRKQSFAAISEHDLVLTTYPLIARDHDVLLARDWHLAVLDEAQTIKNPNAATTRWLREIKATHRVCLTGTPMENHLGELWSIMSFANPGFLGDKAVFVRQWRTPIEKRADSKRAAALAQRVKPFLLRRTKAEVVSELPPKTEIVETIVVEGAQRDLYDSIRLSMSDKVRKAIAARGLARSHIIVLEALLRLRQACCDPALLKLDDGVQRGSAKLERLMEMVMELLSEGRKIIVFSQFTSMIDLIRARFDVEQIRYSLLTGETKNRKQAIEGFQNGGSDVFLISLKAGGVGLNLTAADTVIIFDPWWNPAVEQQAIDRAHRIGQDKAIFVYRMVAARTIEEKMEELKARKRGLADSLFDAGGRIGAALTEDDVKALFES